MADNLNLGGNAFRTKDVGSGSALHAVAQVLLDHSGTDVLGLVTASPGANTMLGRLKTIADNVTALAAHVDGLEGLATSLNGFVDGIEGLLGTANTTLGQLASYTDNLESLQAATTNAVSALGTPDYEAVAAGAADQVMGATGAIGDSLSGVLIVPASTSPGAVSIKDGNGSAITIFQGGANSVTTLHPFFVPFGARASGAGWKISTGANVSAIGVGDFS